MTSNKIAVILLGVFLLTGSVFLGVLTWKNLQTQNLAVNAPAQNDLPVASTSSVAENIATSTTEIQPIAESDIHWLAAPVKLGDLKLVEYAGTPTDMPAKDYYKVASINDGGEIINAFVQPEGPMDKLLIRFKKTAPGKYFLIKQNSYFQDDFGLISKAAIDDKTNIISLNVPEKITLDKTVFNKKEWSDHASLEWDKLKKIGSDAGRDFYIKLTVEANNLKSAKYVLKLPDSSAVYYDITYDFLAGDNTLIASFNEANKEFKEKSFTATISKGCADLTAVISSGDLANRLDPIGTTASGSLLYAPKDINDELFKAVYGEYKIGRNGAADYNGNKVLSYKELAARKPVVVWQDSLGDYHVFYDSNFAAAAECGKPVIYLYPSNETAVRVKVGANVRISEPAYNVGWQVTAYPDGTIINGDGAAYENLYWEGKGRGVYPTITEGRVVKRGNIQAELRRDLAALGLNQKESADFMEFWLDKMPNAPFVRLTWLDTAGMNELAPLWVWPRPDTVKRVFLDFAGQNSAATNLAPQRLCGFERKGFTIVEWGGLLIGNK